MKKQKGFTSVEPVVVLLYLTIVAAFCYGWIENVVKLFHADFGHITGELTLRCIGVVAAPLGAVMGYL